MQATEVDLIRAEMDTEAESYATALEQMRIRTEQYQARMRALTERMRVAMERQGGTVRKLEDSLVPRASRVKLDVGGKIFTVTLDMVTKYPESFFGVLFSERWAKGGGDLEQEVYFINRSAKLFSYIVDFLRGEVEAIEELSGSKRQRLLREAQFYQLADLVKLIGLPQEVELEQRSSSWVLKETINGTLSNRLMTLRQCSEIGGECCMTTGTVGFTKGVHEWSVNLDTGGMGILLGVSLAGIDQTNVLHNESLHFVVSCTDGKVCSGGKWRPFFSQIPAGGMGLNTVVSLRLDSDRRVLLLGLNGLWREDPAFTDLPKDVLFPYFVLGRNIGLQITVTRRQ